MRHRLIRTVVAIGFSALIATTAAARSQEQLGHAALITDIHFNPFDPPNLARDLVNNPVENWPAIFNGLEEQEMSRWGSDTNYALLASSLESFSQAASTSDFGIVLGDLLAHKFSAKIAAALDGAQTQNDVQALATKTTLFVGDAISRALPEKPIFVVLGNNDSGCGDYEITPGGTYLAETREMVRRMAGAHLLSGDFDETYAAGGYYAVRHPTLPKTKILVINNVLWSERYRDRCGADGQAAANAMMNWLREQLEGQKSAGGSVWLVQHIPWGIDPHTTANAHAAACPDKVVPFLQESLSAQLLETMREYQPIILASFASHIHTDGYRLLTDSKAQPSIAQKIVPAVSPVYNQNPGFEIMTYDTQSGRPSDLSTYYLANLESASMAVPGDWRLAYRFSDVYGFKRYSPEAVADLAVRAETGGDSAATYRRLAELGHGKLPDAELAAYSCAITNLNRQDFTACYCGG